MKKMILLLLTALIASASLPASASGWDINSLLNKASAAQSDSTKSGNAGGLGDLISGVANKLGVGAGSVTVDKLAGTWKYSGPAVSFKSDNLLLKAGGAAAASQVEAKLEPYYKTAGFNSLVLTVNTDSTFTFKARLVNLNGTLSKDDASGNFVFHFKALKSINIGSMEAFIVMNGNKMDLTFDVSKLMTLIEKAGKISGTKSLQAASSILNQYDGMTAGFELTKE